MALTFSPGDVAAIATALLGEPNRQASKPDDLRFGKRGSLRVCPSLGVYNSFEDPDDKGGVLDLIKRERGLTGSDAIEFIRGLGIHVEDAGAPPARINGNGHHQEQPAPAQRARIVKAYDYRDEEGRLLFQVCRMEPKDFRQRRPDGDGWTWKTAGTRMVPYRLGELIEAIAERATIFIAEGEKAVDALADLGVPATCSPGGAGKFKDSLVPHFNGADVVILRDNDEPGHKHGLQVAARLDGAANSVRILDLPGLPPKGDVYDWLAAGGTVEQLYDLAQACPLWRRAGDPDVPWEGEQQFPEGEAPPWRSRFGAVPLANINDPGPEYEHLIKGVLTRGEVSMLVGPSGSGKSFLATDAALAIARGVDWLAPQGKPPCRVRKGGVLYIAGEGARGLKKRLRAYLQHHGIDGRVPFVLLTLPVDLHGSDEPTQWLIDEARHHSAAFLAEHGVPLELVVIDTLSASTPGANENASDDVSRVLGRCHRLANEAQCAVMLVHHMNASGQRERGHSSLRANVDSVIEVVKGEARDARGTYGRMIRLAKITKQKDGDADGVTFRFVLGVVTLGQDSDGDPITSCVVEPPDMGLYDEAVATEVDKGAKLSDQAKVFLRAIDQALGDHGKPPPAAMQLPSSVKVVDWKHVREAFQRISTEGQDIEDPEKKAAALRAALKRHGDAFLARKIIGRDNAFGVIWRTGKRVAGERQEGGGSNVVPLRQPDEEATIPMELIDR